MNTPNEIDRYIVTFPEDVQAKLELIRETIRKAAPGATEVISYGMPAFRQDGILCYFAAFKNHIGFFPTPSGVEAFKSELTGYKCTKGTIQLPYNKPMPLELIERIVKFRVKEVLQKKSKK